MPKGPQQACRWPREGVGDIALRRGSWGRGRMSPAEGLRLQSKLVPWLPSAWVRVWSSRAPNGCVFSALSEEPDI